jgi:hypothetical protein
VAEIPFRRVEYMGKGWPCQEEKEKKRKKRGPTFLLLIGLKEIYTIFGGG